MKAKDTYKVYRNLHNGKFSIMDSKGLVVGHADRVMMLDATPVVRENARLRVIKEKRKNVHAFIQGSIFGTDGFQPLKGRNYNGKGGFFCVDARKKVRYNPYESGNFMLHKDNKVEVFKGASCVEISRSGIFCDFEKTA